MLVDLVALCGKVIMLDISACISGLTDGMAKQINVIILIALMSRNDSIGLIKLVSI